MNLFGRRRQRKGTPFKPAGGQAAYTLGVRGGQWTHYARARVVIRQVNELGKRAASAFKTELGRLWHRCDGFGVRLCPITLTTRNFGSVMHFDEHDGRPGHKRPTSCAYHVVGAAEAAMVFPAAGVFVQIETGFAFGMQADLVLHGTSLPWVREGNKVRFLCVPGAEGACWGTDADHENLIFAWGEGNSASAS
jgi:hypothetical protein